MFYEKHQIFDKTFCYSNQNLYLACSTTSSSKTVSLVNVVGSIPERCLWTVSLSDDGVSMSIEDMFNRYLSVSSGTVQLLSTEPSTCDWRYVAAANMKELTSFNISNIELEICKSKVITINSKNPTGANFAAYTDFEYSITATTHAGCVSIYTASTGRCTVSAEQIGTATITVRHKTTNIVCSFLIRSYYELYDYCIDYGPIEKEELIDQMIYSKQFVVLTHAKPHKLANYMENNTADISKCLTLNYISQLPSDYFSEAGEIFIAGCYTAGNVYDFYDRHDIDDDGLEIDYDYNNLCEAIHDKGAPVVGGWKVEVRMDIGYEWIGNLFVQLMEGKGLEEAVECVNKNFCYIPFEFYKD